MTKIELIQKIHKLASNLSKELVFFADGYEDELSTLLSKALKENNINFLREVTNYQYSKSLGLKTDRPDFVLMPDKKNSITKPILIECKFGDISKLIEGREQLIRYLYSHKNSSYDKFGEIFEGVVILWESTSVVSDSLTGSKPSKPSLQLSDSVEEDVESKIANYLEKLGRYQYSVLKQSRYQIKEPVYNCIVELWELKDSTMKKKHAIGYAIK